MRTVNEFRNLLNEKNFKIILTDNFINVINFDRIFNIGTNNITIYNKDKKIKLTGKEMNVIKLLEHEILIKGNILKIEYDK